MRAFKVFWVIENFLEFNRLKVSSNLVPGQLSNLLSLLTGPLFWSFLKDILDSFFDKCVNLGLYFNKISILIMKNDTTS